MTLITQQIDNLTSDMMRLNYLAQEVSHLLNEQSSILQIRNMSLPADVLVRSNELYESLSRMTVQLGDEQTELAQLRALAHTGALINSSLDLNTVLTRAMDTVIGLTDAERGYILLFDENTRETESFVAINIEQEELTEAEVVVSQSIVDSVIQNGEPVLTTNAKEDPLWNAHESVLRYDLRSILCVPLTHRNKVFGVVYADNPIKEELFGPNELQLLVAFANQTAIAIQNARLFERVKARLAEVTEIQQFLDSIFSSIASGVITTDQDGNVRTCNPLAEEILSVSAVDSIGQPLLEVLPPLYEGFGEVLASVQEKGKQEIIEVNTVLASRGPTYLNLKLSPLRGEDGAILGVTLVMDDLTELKKRDETLNVIRTYLPPAMVHNIQSIDGLGLGGDDREISVLSADVRGFTSFSEKLDPQILMEVINQYLTVGSNAIQLFEGIIDKYMGDAIVGLYNTQLNPQPDHPIRAVRTALSIVHDLRGLHDNLKDEERLYYGVGIHTGLATVGNVGSPSRKEFTALGEAINYSKKLQEIALGGEVLISLETYEHVENAFEVELIERALRGDEKIVQVYKVLRPKR